MGNELITGMPTAPYNLTSLTEINGLTDVVLNLNTNLGGTFGLGLLFATFIIIYSIGLWRESDLAFATASWITFIIGTYFGMIGLIGGDYVGALAAMCLVSILLLWNKKKGSSGGY